MSLVVETDTMNKSTPTIVVCGLGNQGSHFMLLARNFQARFKGVDHDRVEAKNVSAQMHSNMGRGQLKTTALSRLMQGLFGFKMDVVPRKIGAHNVEALLGEADLVVDCLDNWTARRIITEFTHEKGIPCVHVGVDPTGSYGQVRWDENFRIEGKDGEQIEATCEDGETLPFNVNVASELARTVQKWLRDGSRQEATITLGDTYREIFDPK